MYLQTQQYISPNIIKKSKCIKKEFQLIINFLLTFYIVHVFAFNSFQINKFPKLFEAMLVLLIFYTFQLNHIIFVFKLAKQEMLFSSNLIFDKSPYFYVYAIFEFLGKLVFKSDMDLTGDHLKFADAINVGSCSKTMKEKVSEKLFICDFSIQEYNLFQRKKQYSENMSVIKDFIGGTLSGIIQVMVMQPFQTVKTRLVNQSLRNPDYTGITDCFRKILSSDGLRGFYQGSLSPLLGVGPQVALQFATNEFVKRAIAKLNEGNRQGGLLTIKEALASGFLTGIPSSLLVTPIDLARTQMQVKDKNGKYHGSVDATKHIIREKGVRGIYLGFYPTLVREMIALSVYFGSYEFGKNRYVYNSGEQNLPLIASFFLGGFAGAASWFFTYPIDYIKTVIQSQKIDRIRYRSALHCARVKFEEEGMKTFYKGLGVTMLRSFPVNGVGFVTFEIAMNFLGRNQINQNAD